MYMYVQLGILIYFLRKRMGFGNFFFKKVILCPEFGKTLPGPDRVNSQHIEKKIIYREGESSVLVWHVSKEA